MILQENLKILTPLQKFPKNVGDLCKFIVAKCLKICPKSNKSPDLVTLASCPLTLYFHIRSDMIRVSSSYATFATVTVIN